MTIYNLFVSSRGIYEARHQAGHQPPPLQAGIRDGDPVQLVRSPLFGKPSGLFNEVVWCSF